MQKIHAHNIKKRAITALNDHSSDYKRLVIRHTALSSLFLLVISLIGLLIDKSIVDTQGLDGIGTAGMLKGVYSAFALIGSLLLPFWGVGILYTSTKVVRGQETSFSMLSQGFRRFASFVGYYVIFALILFLVAIVCFNILIVPFSCMPLPENLQSAAMELDFTDAVQVEAFYTENLDQMMMHMLPFLIVYFSVFALVTLVLSYRFRMCSYILLDDDKVGAMASFGLSARMTKGERKNLFMLDLSFWWYYLLALLISLIVYLPDVLLKTGVIMLESYDVASFIATLVNVVCNLALVGLAGAYYQTSMACAYEALRDTSQ